MVFLLRFRAPLSAKSPGGRTRRDSLTSWEHRVVLLNTPATTGAERLAVDWAIARVEETMADPVYKIVEVVGTSEQSLSKAIDNAISKASGTLRGLGWFEVVQMRGDIRDGKVNRHQVTLKIGFALE